MKKVFLIVAILSIFSSCTEQKSFVIQEKAVENVKSEVLAKNAEYIAVKYRETQVNIADFEELDTSKSSFIRGAWYDAQNEYMIIRLNNTNYHYCGLPKSVWENFKKTNSFGKFFNSKIKGYFDCRLGFVPDYL